MLLGIISPPALLSFSVAGHLSQLRVTTTTSPAVLFLSLCYLCSWCYSLFVSPFLYLLFSTHFENFLRAFFVILTCLYSIIPYCIGSWTCGFFFLLFFFFNVSGFRGAPTKTRCRSCMEVWKVWKRRPRPSRVLARPDHNTLDSHSWCEVPKQEVGISDFWFWFEGSVNPRAPQVQIPKMAAPINSNR